MKKSKVITKAGPKKYSGPKIVTKRNSVSIIDQFAPPIQLLVKLGSIIVHADEAASDNGHEFDWAAFRSLMADREVSDWLEVMTRDGYLPVKRNL